MEIKDLAKPFDPADVEWRAGRTNDTKTKALALAYITSRAVMNRLDAVCGPQNWQDDYRAGPDGGVLAGIGIRFDGNDWVWKWDAAENSQIEAVKGGISDAFKRAAVKWGVGRYLYELDGVWVKCEPAGKSVKLSEIPPLPAWARPEAEKKQPATNGNGKAPRTSQPDDEKATALLLIAQVMKAQVIDHMVEKTNLARQHVESTLTKCSLTAAATLDDFEAWWDLYRGERATGKTSDEAATYANNTMLAQPTA